MIPTLVAKLFDISLNNRLLRAHELAHLARDPEISERDILILEIIQTYGPVTEKSIRTVFGLSPSAANEMVSKLSTAGLIQKTRESDDARSKPLQLTSQGQQTLEKVKAMHAMRYEYLFAGLTAAQEKVLDEAFVVLARNAKARIRQQIFGELPPI